MDRMKSSMYVGVAQVGMISGADDLIKGECGCLLKQ